MTVYTLQVNGTRGEVTPLMHARVDTDFYQAAYALARNVLVTRYGPLTRVPGTLFQGDTKNHLGRSRLLPFRFSATQNYAIEAGENYFRFWTEDGQVFDGGSPYEIASPYGASHLDSIVPVQSGDVVYLFCEGLQPRILRRNGETDWVLELYVPKDGPYLDVNITDTTLTVAETGHATPAMTSNTAPSGEVTSTDGGADSYLMFDRDKETEVTAGAGSVAVVTYDFGSGVQKVVNSYWLVSGPTNVEWGDMPTSWAFQGSNDGTSWVTIDSRDGETNWTGTESRYYEFTNRVAYRYYRFNLTGGGGDDGTATSVAEISMGQAASDQTPFTVTASATTGINDGQGFLASDVGRSIRIYGSDGRWRWLEVKSWVSSTVVTAVVHGYALPDTSAIGVWALGAWSDSTGWPRTGKFYEDRLFTAGTETDPLGVWASVSADYDNYRRSTPGVDDDGLTLRLTGGSINLIHWLAESGALLAGTPGSLRSIGSRDNANVMSPTNVKQRQETAVRASDVQPSEIETVVLFVDKLRKRLYEAAYSYEADGYLAREVSTLNEHLFLPGIDEIAYIDEPNKFIAGRRSDGKVVLFSYDREQKVAGGTLADFGGTVESVLSLPGSQSDDLWMIVNRTINGAERRFVEKLGRFYRVAQQGGGVPVYGACSYHYSGAPTSTVSGLDALEGKTAGVWADGRDIGDTIVSGARADLPYDIEAQEIVIGERMPWKVNTLRLAQIGNRDGSGLGRNCRLVSAYIDVLESAGIRYGTPSQIDEMFLEDMIEQNPDDPEPLITGMHPMPVDDDWQNRGVFVIEGDRMYPATIRGISLNVEGEP